MSAEGTWNIALNTPAGEKKLTFVLHAEGDALKGTMIDNGVSSDILKGKAEGAIAKWSVKVKRPMPMTLEFTGTIDGDAISGGAKSLFGTAQFTGQRG